MQIKNKLDKIAYIMLNIATVIVLILILAIIGALVWTGIITLVGITGYIWLFAAVAFIGVYLCIVYVSWFIQCIVHLIGLIQYRKNNMTAARILGIVNSLISMASSLYLIIVNIMVYGNEQEYQSIFLATTVISGIAIIYMMVPFVLLIVSMCKKNKAV